MNSPPRHPQVAVRIVPWLRHDAAPAYAAMLIALLLSLPTFGFTYLTDDYDFLARAQRFTPSQLLPDSSILFYRPLSREIYFTALYALGPMGPFVGHCVNVGLVAWIVLLSYRIVQRTVSPIAASTCALAVACFSQWPLLVGWLSGIQDLLCIALVLKSAELALTGSAVPSAICFGGALISKESALLALPSVIAIPLFLRRRSGWASLLRGTMPTLAMTAAWAVLHPGVQSLIHRRGVTGPGGYLGFDNERRWEFLWSTIGSTFNVHVPSGAVRVPPALVASVLVVIVILLVLPIVWQRSRPTADAVVDAGPDGARLATGIGGFLAVAACVLPALAIKHWAPYYAAFPAVGAFIALAPLAARLPQRLIPIGLVVYLIVGLSGRISDFGRPRAPTEASLGALSARLSTVQKRIRIALPAPERGSTLVLSVHTPPNWEVARHLFSHQAPRIWYRDPNLIALDPFEWKDRAAPEYLLFVSADLDVQRVGDQLPPVPGPNFDRDRAVRNYAMGRAAGGDPFNACRLLLTIESGDSRIRALDARLAVLILLSSGKRGLGERALRQLPPLPEEAGFAALRAVLPLPWPGAAGDSIAFRVLGVDYSDPKSVRRLLHLLIDDEVPSAALRIAERLRTLQPEDRYAIEVVEWLRSIPDWERATIPVDPWTETPAKPPPPSSARSSLF